LKSAKKKITERLRITIFAHFKILQLLILTKTAFLLTFWTILYILRLQKKILIYFIVF